MSPTLCLAVLVFFASIFVICCSYLSLKRSHGARFPSPPKELILGHLRILPQESPWLAFTEWAKDYGDIIELSVFGSTIIIINTAEDAYKLMEKRGNNYSDRPRICLQGELIGCEYLLAFVRYGDTFRTLRRYVTQYFNSVKHRVLYPQLEVQVKMLLKNLLVDPQRFKEHLERLTAGIIVKTTYGHEISPNDDSYIKLAEDAVSGSMTLGVAGLNPIDLFPFLRYVPLWIPGSGILRRAKRVRELVRRMMDEPYDQTMAKRGSGIKETCLVHTLLEENERNNTLDEKRKLFIKSTAAQIYGAGMETTVTTLQTFIFLLMLHREIAQKAQAQIDEVVGTGQLPTLEDRPELPYIDCIIKEVLRHNPPVPLGIPHVALQDDIYDEKRIIAGSMVMSNIWAMMRDERYFTNPDTFNPDRFYLRNTTPTNEHQHPLNSFRPDDPSSLVFGFGRRICPGRYFADASIWLVVANILAVFDILPPIDPDTGKTVMPKFEWTGGMTSKLKPFRARVVPRSEKHTVLIV